MFDRGVTPDTGRERRSARADRADEGRWENEGGATPEPSPVITASPPHRAQAESPTGRAAAVVDARQDELMTMASSDGRPPSRRRRLIEWRWFGVGMFVIIAGVVSWIAVEGVNLGAAAAGLALGALLLVGTNPVLAAGLLRGREERAARKRAQLERRGARDWRIEPRDVDRGEGRVGQRASAPGSPSPLLSPPDH